jgi:hypothetical protein
MARSKSTQEMVIKALIREVVYSIDTSKYKDLKLSQGKLIKDISEGASRWLTTIFGVALCIFGWKLKNAIDGLGSRIDQLTATASTAVDTATAAVASTATALGATAATAGAASTTASNESSQISEVKIKTRFNKGGVIESETVIQIAEQLIASIRTGGLDLDVQLDDSIFQDSTKLERAAIEFNDKVEARVRDILKLCTEPSRTYPGSLSRFRIPGIQISMEDIDASEKPLLEKALLDVAAIQLMTLTNEKALAFYGILKEGIDDRYSTTTAEKSDNIKYTGIINRYAKDLMVDLDAAIKSSTVEHVFKA